MTLVVVLAALLASAGCTRSAAAHGASAGAPLHVPSPRASPHPGTWSIVALGDSVTSGGPCHCSTFPGIYARKLAYARGVHTTSQNLGRSGEDSGRLLAALRARSSREAAAVRGADIDLLTIGANDFSGYYRDVTEGRCLGDRRTDCVQDAVLSMERNVEQIIRTIHRLRGTRPTAVLVTGYWNVFEDGAVARRDYPRIGVRATRRLTALANDGIKAAADRAGATYVDLVSPFEGPRTGGDPTGLLGADGNHPNARGQDLIAARLLAAGLPGLARS